MNPGAAAEPDPQVQRILETIDAAGAPALSDVSPEDARQLMETMADRGSSIAVASVEDRSIDGPDGDIPVRIYDPDGGERPQPLVLYFHGGGWVVGSLDTHDSNCRKLADETDYVVVSVDYRLAPEHPFPAGLEDCYAAFEWAAANAANLGADADRLVLAGDSAGGNLATTTALLARYRDGPTAAYQLLFYPGTGDATTTDSYEENAEGYFLTADEMTWFRNHYFDSDIDQGNVFAFPRLADDLSGLPPATILTAGFDPLRDDGAAYATRLEEDGVSVTHRNYPAMIHGFAGMLEEPMRIDRAHEAYAEAAADLRDALE